MSADKKKAFTLIEMLVSLAIVLILVGALVGMGRYLRTRAERQLTQSAIEVIVTALEQYYDQTDPKQFPPQVNSDGELKTVLAANTVTVSRGMHPDSATDIGKAYWRSEAAFYFLDKISQSRTILNSLSNQMLSNKGLSGVGLQIQIQLSSNGTTDTYDWVRFVDAWGTSLNYTYSSGDAFPVITSAGPDKNFNTTGDNLSSQ